MHVPCHTQAVTPDLTIVAAAMVVGFLVGLTGVGGGAIMTPLLIAGFGIPAIVAIATDLVFATVTKIVSALVHARHSAINWKVARLVWSGSLPATVIGVFLAVLLSAYFSQALGSLLILMLLVTAVSMLRSRPFIASSISKIKGRLGGAVIGLSVATTSIGAGALGMALLRSLLGDRDPKQLVGTDIVHAIPVALIAGSGYAIGGYLDFLLLANLLLGSIPGVILGSLFIGKLPAQALRKSIAVLLIIAAAGVALKLWGLL